MEHSSYSSYSDEYFRNEIWETFRAGYRNRKTVCEYMRYIRALCNFCQKDFLQINEVDANKYFQFLSEQYYAGELSGKTLALRLSCCNALARHIIEEYPQLNYKNAFRKIVRPDVNNKINLNRIPTLKDIDAVLTAAKSDMKMYIIIVLAARTAMMANRILSITPEAVMVQNQRVWVLLPPKSDDKPITKIPLPKDVGELLITYMESHFLEDGVPIFLNRHGNPMTLKNLDVAFKKIMDKSQVENRFTIRDLRTRAILEFVDAGADEDELCDYVGIGKLRMRDFNDTAKIISLCPGDLLNYQIKYS